MDFQVEDREQQLTTKVQARLLVKGFVQKNGINFEKSFSLMVKMYSITVILGLTVSLNLEVEQFDINTTFLHSDLKKGIYVEQLDEFKIKSKENLMCRLKKNLYGLK